MGRWWLEIPKMGEAGILWLLASEERLLLHPWVWIYKIAMVL